MKTRLLFLILLFANITIAQGLGVGTETPVSGVDIAKEGMRIRDINLPKYESTNHGDRWLTVKKEGYIAAEQFRDSNAFHARLRSDQSIAAGALVYLILDTPVVTSSIYYYNSDTGSVRFDKPGNYRITMQGGFDVGPKVRMVLGIRSDPSDQYLGRASHYSSTQVGVGVSEVMSYTTVLVVPYSGFQIRFSAAAIAAATLLKSETGTTGAASVTNVTIERIN